MAFEYFSDIKPMFEKEIARYPQHHLPYGQYFNLLSLQINDASKPIIKEHLKKLEGKATTPKVAPDLMTALCVGYAKSDQLSYAKKYMIKLLEEYPTSGFTSFAYIFYDYECYKSGLEGAEKEILEKCRKIFISHPDAPISQDLGLIYRLRDDKTIATKYFRNALLPLIERQPMNNRLQEALIDVCIDRREYLNEADAMLLNTLNRFHRGEGNHFYRMPATRYKMAVGTMYRQLAEIAVLQKNYNNAATYATAGLSTGDESLFMQKVLKIRAKAFKAAKNLTMAMDDYQSLYAMGDKGAMDTIKVIFNKLNGDLNDFPAFLEKLSKKNNKNSGNVAPDFTASDLQGNKVTLKDLKGKIVVLNFWGIGCGPCIREMPDLNKLVEKYRSNTSVVFLAISYDETDALTRFFHKRRFDYSVVNNGGDVWKDYDVSTQPVHIVINQNGDIIARINGAQEGIQTTLEQWISKSL